MIQKKKCNKTRDKSKRQWKETEKAKKEKKRMVFSFVLLQLGLNHHMPVSARNSDEKYAIIKHNLN